MFREAAALNSAHPLQMELEVTDHDLPRAFFAYPSEPYARSETIKQASRDINKAKTVHIRPWEDMSISGKNVIGEICREINLAQVFCADITGLNPNVMFELGYAIARDKRIWLVFDTSFTDLRKQFDQFQILTTTGYSKYTNSDDIVNAFFHDHPHLDLDNTIFRSSIKPTLSPEEVEALLYLKALHDTNASIRISNCLNDAEIPRVLDDPKESGVQPLSWYGQKVYSAAGIVAHLLSHARQGSQITNAKYSLVSGLAYGFGKPLLMLAEPEYVSPLDYRDLLFNYKSAQDALRHLEQWLTPIEEDYRKKVVQRDHYAGVLKLEVELRDFYVQIGEYLAENEADTLENYYVQTTAYREALAGTRRLFVGRKGTGKTANMITLAAELRKHKDNVVCVLQPVGYELESLVKLFRLFSERDAKGYVIESLWKFLLLTELANATAAQIEDQPPWVQRDDDEKRLLEFLGEDERVLRADFSVRLEHCVSALLISTPSSSIEQQRKGISEALHETAVKTLRTLIGDVLSKKDRVAVLIDNLDKAWVKQADIARLSEFLLGLFTATDQLINDLSRKDSRRKAVNCTAAIFLRSDIFSQIIEIAREPDKLAVTRLAWKDTEMLSRVVEMRFSASHPGAADGSELWSRYFCPTIKGQPTKEYMLSRVLPRPRDIVYLLKGAISTAVNRGHNRIQDADVVAAEYEYSRYAMDSIMFENSITLPQLESVLYEFAGSPDILTQPEVAHILSKAHIPQEKHLAVTEHLIGLSFLGIEIDRNQFVYSDEPRELRKNMVLAINLARDEQSRRYAIHPAFWAFLEIGGVAE
jgi:hypothetical protein